MSYPRPLELTCAQSSGYGAVFQLLYCAHVHSNYTLFDNYTNSTNDTLQVN